MVGKAFETHSVDLVRCRRYMASPMLKLSWPLACLFGPLVACPLIRFRWYGDPSSGPMFAPFLTISFGSDDFRCWSHVLPFVVCVSLRMSLIAHLNSTHL